MMHAVAIRMLRETDMRLLLKFAYNMCWKGMLAVNRFKRRLKKGEFFPAFVFMSVTNNCNLRCQGCWVTRSDPPAELSESTMNNIVEECKRKGSYFFGLLGGEPLMHDATLNVPARNPDCYFQVFTNGTLLTDDVAREMRRLGNVTPLVSIEGLEEVSDERRGGQSVYARSMKSLEHCRNNRLIFGVATSICASNFDELVSDRFVEDLISRGVHYLWYYIYRPVGPDPCPELTLTDEQVLALRRFIVEGRSRFRIALVDAYWDDKGRALCPAAVGISHHISPTGDVEPCPPIQFARDNVGTGEGLAEVFDKSQFLSDFRSTMAETTRGCILLEKPEVLHRFLVEQEAFDSSGRGTGFEELSRMGPQPGHNMPGREIPEKNWIYRFAKRNWFFGFGAYG